jgi:hypothetical protein
VRFNHVQILTFLIFNTVKNASRIVFAAHKIHVIHASMVLLFTKINAFNALKPQEFTVCVQDAAQDKLGQFSPVLIALLFQENILSFFLEDVF